MGYRVVSPLWPLIAVNCGIYAAALTAFYLSGDITNWWLFALGAFIGAFQFDEVRP